MKNKMKTIEDVINYVTQCDNGRTQYGINNMPKLSRVFNEYKDIASPDTIESIKEIYKEGNEISDDEWVSENYYHTLNQNIGFDYDTVDCIIDTYLSDNGCDRDNLNNEDWKKIENITISYIDSNCTKTEYLIDEITDLF